MRESTKDNQQLFDPASMEPIAIIGMGCRYPGANGLAEFWTLLRNGVDAITEIPPTRWDIDEFYDPDIATPGTMQTRWGGFLDGIDQFDARFFSISPREAKHLDPQQRQLLEVTWEALENGGQTLEMLDGSPTSVFIATLGHDYDEYIFDDYTCIDAYIGTGNAHSLAANRLSYVFNLNGPSVAMDSACSGSLVAIHTACQSLRSGESSMAIAGGVNAILLPKTNIFFSKAGAIALNGRCKAFDASADGIVRSEGVGIVILKRLSDAIAAGDPIHALVIGSAVNSDGKSNGLMAPNQHAQEALLREAYRRTGIAPQRVQYIEAHGTGTPIGDTTEIHALHAVLGANLLGEQFCALGSVKSNIGHSEAAAGVAGIIKTALALQHRELPPSLHISQPNPALNGTQLRLQREAGAWPRPAEPLVAGVSAFGIGGTNAHIVMAEYPRTPGSGEGAVLPSAQLLTVSARTPAALRALAQVYERFLATASPELWQDICYTALKRRTHHQHRLALVAATPEAAAEQLASFGRDESAGTVSVGQKHWEASQRLAFVFSGQGSHWLGMGRDLLEGEPVFREMVGACDVLIKRITGWSLLAELQAPPEQSRLNHTEVTQPAIFAIQVGLAALWQSWGVIPDVVVGHSLGEVAAAFVAGGLTLEDAVLVVVHRSRLMQHVAGKGLTAVVELPIDQAQLMLAANEAFLGIAGSNSPASTVISGDPDRVTQVVQFLEQRGVFCRILKNIDIAFHSPQMDPLKTELVAALAEIQPHAALIPIYSTVTSQRHDGTMLGAAYWGRNLREPFMFTATFQAMLRDEVTTFLEVSPHPVLELAMREGLEHAGTTRHVLSSLRRDNEGRATLLHALGTLYTHGHRLDGAPISGPTARVTTLPAYAWQHETYWYYGGSVQPARRVAASPSHRARNPLLGHPLTFAVAPATRVWETTFSAASPASMQDHRVHGAIIVPGAAYVELALAGANQLGINQVDLEQIRFEQALFLPETGSRRVQTVISRENTDTYLVQILSLPDDPERGVPVLHAQGRISQRRTANATLSDLAAIRQRCLEHVPGVLHYQRMSQLLGLQYGPAYQAVRDIWRRDGEVIGVIDLPANLAGEAARCFIHPSLLDAAFQMVTATLPMHEGAGTDDNSFLPASLGSVRQLKPLGRQAWVHIVLTSAVSLKAEAHRADIFLLDEAGEVLVEVRDLLLLPLASAQVQQPADWLYQLAWEPVTLAESSAAPGDQDGWLIIGAGGGRSAQLAQALTARNQRILQPLDESQSLEVALAQADATFGSSWRGILYMRGLDMQIAETTAATQLELEQHHSVGGLLELTQALAATPVGATPALWIVTSGAQALPASPVTAPQQTSLWGFGRVLLREHSELRGRLIDLDPLATDVEAAIDALLADGADEQLAVRGATYAACRMIPNAVSQRQPAWQWHTDGTYLITGGLGGLGLSIAHWMVAQGARRLILLGRTLLPQRSDWRDIPTATPQCQTIESIRQLEALGASVHIAAVDIADEVALATFLEHYRQEGWPPIRGVVHAAGVLHDQLITTMEAGVLQEVLRPKVLGAWNLHRLLSTEPLDFFVLFSSIASILGSIGQSNYAAGNGFLDGLADYRRSRGLPAQSINWGPWSEVGMAARNNINQQLAANGIDAFTPAQGHQLLELALRTDSSQLVALAARWERWPQSGGIALVANLLRSAGHQGGQSIDGAMATLRQELLALDEGARQQVLEAHLQQVVARVLRISDGPIDPQQPINTLGLDSIMALELKTTIQGDTGVSMPLVAILQGPSISQCAAQILEQIQPNPVDDDLARVLAEIEGISLEETRTYLHQEGL